MELRQLRYAIAVADHRHFTRAAASVPVAQPALSHQVRLLEQELGIELFERSRSGVRLTEAGEIFLLRARRALAEMDAAREEIAALKGLASGRLVLGAMQALAGLDLPRLLAAFHAAHPGIDVSLREDSTRDMFTLAARGEIDLAIAALDVDRPPGLDAVPLVREPVLMAVPTAHPLASQEAVAFRQLRHETFILFKEGTGLRAVSDGRPSGPGSSRAWAFRPAVTTACSPCQRRTRGGARARVRRERPATAGLAVLPVLPEIDRTVGAVWRADHRHTPAASAFLGLLRERARPQAAGSSARRRDGVGSAGHGGGEGRGADGVWGRFGAQRREGVVGRRDGETEAGRRLAPRSPRPQMALTRVRGGGGVGRRRMPRRAASLGIDTRGREVCGLRSASALRRDGLGHRLQGVRLLGGFAVHRLSPPRGRDTGEGSGGGGDVRRLRSRHVRAVSRRASARGGGGGVGGGGGGEVGRAMGGAVNAGGESREADAGGGDGSERGGSGGRGGGGREGGGRGAPHPDHSRGGGGGGGWGGGRGGGPPTGSTCRATCSTASTRSFRPRSRSTSPTTCGTPGLPRLRPHSAAGRAARGIGQCPDFLCLFCWGGLLPAQRHTGTAAHREGRLLVSPASARRLAGESKPKSFWGMLIRGPLLGGRCRWWGAQPGEGAASAEAGTRRRSKARSSCAGGAPRRGGRRPRRELSWSPAWAGGGPGGGDDGCLAAYGACSHRGTALYTDPAAVERHREGREGNVDGEAEQLGVVAGLDPEAPGEPALAGVSALMRDRFRKVWGWEGGRRGGRATRGSR